MAGKNGTHFAHHSRRTTHRQSSSGVLWNRPVSIVWGERRGLLLSDNKEYNMWFRGKVLLHLATSAKSLAFSWIFTSYFLREAIFCALKWYTGPAKSWRRLFMATCERVHSSLPTFISITPFAILIFEPQPFHTGFGEWEGSVSRQSCWQTL